MARLRLPAPELLRPHLLARGAFRLPHENDNEDDDPGVVETVDSDAVRRREMENAARLALLLCRAAARSPDLSLAQLAEFWVDFEERDRPDAGEEDAGPGRVLLLGVDDLTPTAVDLITGQPQQIFQQATPLKHLGRLLYSVFSRGQSLHADLTLPGDEDVSITTADNTATTSTEGGSDVSSRRSSQRSRTTRVTVFSQLVDGRAFPLSVCRLLSDLIDDDPRAGGQPFASFNHVLLDLELMISRSEVFLHDSYHPHRPWTPAFGRVHRGRGEEVGKLLGIADEMDRSLQSESAGRGWEPPRLEAAFVSGIAGSGKSHLVQAVGDALEGLGWTVSRAKFEKGREYFSCGMVSRMIDNVLARLVALRAGGEPDDVAYFERVSRSIAESVDRGLLSRLVGVLPHLPSLIPGLDWGAARGAQFQKGVKLVYPLSKILEAVLEPGRFVMMVADDLQWADKTSLSLISEILIKVGGVKDVSRRCLFLGVFRPDEVGGGDLSSARHFPLRGSSFIHMTEIELAGLSRDDIVDMVMSELKLPRRVVADLPDAIYTKTSGHALFVVELLNSLLNESIIAYSMQTHSFAWDPARIDFIQMSENVAELIASNLKSLAETSLYILQILSTFGNQMDLALLKVLEENFQAGMDEVVLSEFVERGILERAGPLFMFTHDLILDAVYESIPDARRQLLHLELGLCLGARALEGADALDGRTFFAGSQLTSSLLSLACDQINHSGVEPTNEGDQRNFALWNLTVGRRAMLNSNFSAAAHYFGKGLSFLGEDGFSGDPELCEKLHRSVVEAAFALGWTDVVMKHADILIDHLAFHEAIDVHRMALKSMSIEGKEEEGKTRGRDILRRLNIDIPDSASHETSIRVTTETDRIVDQFGIDDVVNLCDNFKTQSAHDVVKIIGVFTNFFWNDLSMHNLLACESVKYSLMHGICLESVASFAIYGAAQIMAKKYASGKRCADICTAIMNHYQTEKRAIDMTPLFYSMNHVYCYIEFWFTPLRTAGRRWMLLSDEAMKFGDFDTSFAALSMSWLYVFHGGENLSIINQSSLTIFQRIAKNHQPYAKIIISDFILLTELTGKYEDYFLSLKGSFTSLDDIQAEFQPTIFLIEVTKLSLKFWRGDDVAAEEHARIASAEPDKKSPVHYTSFCFFGALVYFRRYRFMGGDDRLEKGREMLLQMKDWAKNSPATFGSKSLLLKAEHAASVNEDSDVVKQCYNDANRTARDHGNIHDLALGHELLGNYCASQGQMEDSNDCFLRAFVYFRQWGAAAVAERIFCDHGLDNASVSNMELQIGDLKHSRFED